MATNSKRASVVLLRTENESKLWSNKGRRLYYNQNNPNDPTDEIRYHLYLTIEEEVNVGDYVIQTNFEETHSSIIKIESERQCEIANIGDGSYTSRKLIATDDESLTLPIPESIAEYSFSYTPKNFHKPSHAFIGKYACEYNKGNIITDVDVEYCPTEWFNKIHGGCWQPFPDGTANIKRTLLKIDPTHNTITIHPIKNMWNKEEVIDNMWKAYLFSNTTFDNDESLREEFDAWIISNI